MTGSWGAPARAGALRVRTTRAGRWRYQSRRLVVSISQRNGGEVWLDQQIPADLGSSVELHRREVGDRAGEAVTRYNIAMTHRADGNLALAGSELERVVNLDRQVRLAKSIDPTPHRGHDEQGGATAVQTDTTECGGRASCPSDDPGGGSTSASGTLSG